MQDKAKHIEIKHHFTKVFVQKRTLDINIVDTKHKWANILTKRLAAERFKFIKENLNIVLSLNDYSNL